MHGQVRSRRAAPHTCVMTCVYRALREVRGRPQLSSLHSTFSLRSRSISLFGAAVWTGSKYPPHFRYSNLKLVACHCNLKRFRRSLRFMKSVAEQSVGELETARLSSLGAARTLWLSAAGIGSQETTDAMIDCSSPPSLPPGQAHNHSPTSVVPREKQVR